MTYRTRQEIFDLAYRGLAAQGWKQSSVPQSKSNGVGTCRYRHPDDGLKCAIGHCIDDDHYSPALEGNGADSDVVVIAANIDPEDWEFAEHLQSTHDDAATAQGMRRDFEMFAQEYNLTIPEVA